MLPYGASVMPVDPRLEPVMAGVRKLLKQQSLTHAAVEKKAGYGTKYLSKLLNGQVDMKLVQLYDVLEALHVSPGEFFLRVYPDAFDERAHSLVALHDEMAKLGLSIRPSGEGPGRGRR